MTSSTDPFTAHCLDLLSPLGRPRAKRMFGGVGLYVDDLFIALIAFEQFFLKADAETRPRFEAAGCRPFTYEAAGKTLTMGYFSAPDEAMESPALMQPWATLALQAALRAQAAKPASAPRRAAAAPPAKRASPRKAAASGNATKTGGRKA